MLDNRYSSENNLFRHSENYHQAQYVLYRLATIAYCTSKLTPYLVCACTLATVPIPKRPLSGREIAVTNSF